MKCILHIGTEKTGTTSIQKFLEENRPQLTSHGVYFPVASGQSHSRHLVTAAYSPDREDDFTRNMGLLSSEDRSRFQNETIKCLEKEIRSLHEIHTVVFSSEHFQSRLRSEVELDRLASILERLPFHSIEILVYLRDPVAIANSLFSTAVEFGAIVAQPPSPSNEYWSNICNHRQTLKRFADVFGHSALHPRIFSSETLLKGSVVEDFVHAIGLETALDSFSLPESTNKGMSRVAIEVLRRLNRSIPEFTSEGKPNPARKGLVDHVREHLNHGPSYQMPQFCFQHYREAFAESNEWVRQQFFPGRKSLFPEESRSPQSQSDFWSSGYLDLIAAWAADLWMQNKGTETSAEPNARIPPHARSFFALPENTPVIARIPWLGFVDLAEFPKIHHESLGPLWCAGPGAPGDSFFFNKPAHGWYWTKPDVFPLFRHMESGQWIPFDDLQQQFR